jgi:hypothetical protein
MALHHNAQIWAYHVADSKPRVGPAQGADSGISDSKPRPAQIAQAVQSFKEVKYGLRNSGILEIGERGQLRRVFEVHDLVPAIR